MLGAIGDGFGAFRPSTSFNDLTTLLEGEAAKAAEAAIAAATKAPKEKKSKKRASTGANPSPKRKAGNTRRVSATGKKDATKLSIGPSPTPVIKDPPPLVVKPVVAVKDDSAVFATTPVVAVVAASPPPKPAAPVTVAPAPVVPAAAVSCTAVAAAAAAAVATKGTESGDFKAIAQAAVSSLMSNASSGTTEAAAAAAVAAQEKSKGMVDTSTAHIKALTGNNWVAACAGATQGIVTVQSVHDPKNPNRARRQSLTQDERARQNRDRNREHARNTRLRKKAYVEELKKTLTELVAQRDAAELEQRQSAQRELEQREVRFRVIEEFLKLRGRNETNFARWAAILEDGFTFNVPTTDYRKLAQGEAATDFEQVFNGVSDVMSDASVFSSFLQTLGSGEGVVTCQYNCDRKNFFMDGCQAVLEWTATSVGAVNKVRYCVRTYS
jgi:hypothetical protein